MTITLATDRQFPRPPIDVIESQTHDLAATQPQPHHQLENRERARTRRPAPIAAIKQCADLLRFQVLRQPREPPMGDRWNALRQRLADCPVEVQEPQQRPQRRDGQLRRLPRAPPTVRQHERVHVPGREARKFNPLGRRSLGQKRRDSIHVPRNSGGIELALDHQITAIACKQLLHRLERHDLSPQHASTRDAAMTSHIDLPLGTDNREVEPRSAARDYADQSPRLTAVCGDFRSTSAQPLGRPNTYCTLSAPTITRATISATPTISRAGWRRIAPAAAVRWSPPRPLTGSTSRLPQPGQAIATRSVGYTATATRRGGCVRSAALTPAPILVR